MRFFEKVFPFKINNVSTAPDPLSQSLNHVNFFDEVTSEDSGTPNDDNNTTSTPLGNNDQDDHHLGDGSHS